MRKISLGLILFIAWPLTAASLDQSKKVYELIYEDVQALKQQLLKLEAKFDKAAEDILLLKNEVRDLQAQMKLTQSGQAGLKEDVRSIPVQYQSVLDKLEQINLLLAKLSEDFLALKAQVSQPAEAVKPETPSGKESKDSKSAKKEEPAPPQPEAPPNSALAPKDVYDMAYADYIKGNYELAMDGFRIYREQFSASPLADDALYWIGECYFSLKKYAEAIEQFNLLIFNYPQGNKLPAAYLKKGLSFIELGKRDEALSVFKLLVSKYPNEEETKNAQQKIKEMTSNNERHQ